MYQNNTQKGIQNHKPSQIATIRYLNLVRVDGIEYYFYEFDDAMTKMRQVSNAQYERIPVH